MVCKKTKAEGKPELLHQFEMIGQLTKEDQATIKNVIKAMIMKNQMEKVISQ